MKVVFFNPFGKPGEFHEALAAFDDVEYSVAASLEELPAKLPGAEVLVTANRIYTPEPAALIREHGKSLRWIAFTTSGIDKAVASGLPQGVSVTNMSGLRAFAVAEHALHLMLALVRAARDVEGFQRKGEWARVPLTPLMDNLTCRHIVILGTGAIGQDIARKAKAFDMRVTGVSRTQGSLAHFDAIVPREELVSAAAEADFLVVAALAEKGTDKMVSRRVIEAMQPHAYLVNIARGSLVDEPALIEALQHKRIAGAGLDVQESEPTPEGHPLWALDNVIVTPHLGGAGSDGDGTTHASLFVDNLICWRAGKPLTKVVIEKTAD